MGRLIGILFLCIVSVAHATEAEDARARELHTNGKMLFEEGRHAEALLAWNEAYALSERHLLLFNIALAQEELGLLEEAVSTLFTYRVYASPEEQPSLIAKIAELEHRLKVSAAEPATEPSDLLAPEPVAPEPVAPEPVVPEPTPERVPAVAVEASSWDPVTVALWSGVGISAASGLSMGLMAYKEKDLLSEYCSEVEGPEKLICNIEGEYHMERMERFTLLSDLSWGLTGVALGAVLWRSFQSTDSESSASSTGLWFGNRSVGVQGRF
jgi:hypothetical protein